MKTLLVGVVLVSLVSIGCGDVNPSTPSLTSKDLGKKATAGSTVAILDNVLIRKDLPK